MDKELYNMIFKRKSFHHFKDIGNEHITNDELEEIEKQFYQLKPLVDDIEVKIVITKDETTCKRGQEYCILFYSEKKDNYLQNIGYLGEQLDLYLVSKNIGTLWFGLGRAKERQVAGLDYVIMMAIAKVDSEDKFRKDMYESKRKAVTEIWNGGHYLDIADVVRFAPSACNLQPWVVDSSVNELKVYRYKKGGITGKIAKSLLDYFNQIDIGIFLCFLEVCMDRNEIEYDRSVLVEENGEKEKNLTAIYDLK